MTKNLFLLFFCLSYSLYSQNRAPSIYLNYQDSFSGDIIVNTLRVPSVSPMYTYYCSMGWHGNNSHGYAGFQEHPNGRNFIFSMWNPTSTTMPITADYIGTGTIFEPFGGEGTGMKSTNNSVGWQVDSWYTLVSRAWSGQSNNTLFGYWVFDNTKQKWTHLVTFNYPVPNVGFNSYTYSFIEDWLGNGWLQREIHHKEGWKRRSSDKVWKPFTSSNLHRVYPDAGTVNYIDKYDGGTTSEYYFMKSGGSAAPVTNTAGTTLYVPNSKAEPQLEHGHVSALTLSTLQNKVEINWINDERTLPQFSYSILIYDNPSFSGSPVKQAITISPQSRNAVLDVTHLVNGKTYYIKFFTTDIFDNNSLTLKPTFVAKTTTLSVHNSESNSTKIYPNPFIDEFSISLNSLGSGQNTHVTLVNAVGQIVLKNDFKSFNNTISIKLNKKIPIGEYTAIVEDGKSKIQFKLIKTH